MKRGLIITLAILAAVGGLIAGALLGVLFAGLLIGLVGAAIVVAIGWGAAKAARHKLSGDGDESPAVTGDKPAASLESGTP